MLGHECPINNRILWFRHHKLHQRASVPPSTTITTHGARLNASQRICMNAIVAPTSLPFNAVELITGPPVRHFYAENFLL